MRAIHRGGRGWVRVVAAATLATTVLAGCNEFLQVENPGAIEATKLSDATYLGLLNNGVIGEFQRSFPQVIYYASLFGDELRNHGVFFEERLFDLRDVLPENGTLSFFVYNPLQRARFMADSAVGRMKGILGDSAGADLRVARALTYGAYQYSQLGEYMCSIPIDGSAPMTPDQIFTIAIQKVDSAITIAAAAKAKAQLD